ncbi:MAG: 16S rRNA (guanine(966)-N(2))-methyltransferase RsmD [Chlorobiaceae bacterium]|nr:16S rRNA (guanine(966)-N(2))-methyltransferase RsmD [Chlorobiaceae bacterium]MBA4309950.1 16S rRNA (guanine(966)-N(2))-methyltransferase RsmD [Chlorobiaceae bacterium]
MKLRIISGEFKGRYIKSPDSKLTRPTTERVRETIFNLLQTRLDLDGINVLDIYAGSGSFGFEALSRGAALVHFIEKNFAIYKNLEENIHSLEVNDRAKIFKVEAAKFPFIAPVKYDLIFADPPFFAYDIYRVVENIYEKKILSDEGILLIERSIQTLAKDVENFKLEPFKRIGDACIYEFVNK